MSIELKKLSLNDNIDVYNMLQEIPKEENGFINNCNGKSFEEFQRWLERSDCISKNIGLEDFMVPQDIYWLYVDGIPVGMGKLRHYLTDKLREDGGHLGYAIRPAYRNKGYGKLLLQLLIERARKLHIEKLLITVQNHNYASIAVALVNGAKIEKVSDIRHYIWIEC